MNFNQILETYGIAGLVIILASLAIYRITISIAKGMSAKADAKALRMNSETKQDDMFNNLLTQINAERVASQDRERAREVSNNHLTAELMDLKSKWSFEAGRNDVLIATMQRERDEWKAERIVTDDKIRTMETSILDLQKNQRDNQTKIKELESQIESLNKRIADADGVISTLQAMVKRLEDEKSQLLELNTELRKQVDERNARINNLSILNQLKQEVETETPVPPAILLSDATQAIPDMRDVDDTIHPIPLDDDGNPKPVPPLPDTETKPPLVA